MYWLLLNWNQFFPAFLCISLFFWFFSSLTPFYRCVYLAVFYEGGEKAEKQIDRAQMLLFDHFTHMYSSLSLLRKFFAIILTFSDRHRLSVRVLCVPVHTNDQYLIQYIICSNKMELCIERYVVFYTLPHWFLSNH